MKTKKNYIIILAATAIFLNSFCKEKTSANGNIGAGEILEKINGGALIVDVRTPQEFQMGHYPEAINIPLQTVQANISGFGSPEQEIIVYCRSGNRSVHAKRILNHYGFKNVIDAGALTQMPR